MYQFNGYDWTELADCWNINAINDEEASVLISKYMMNNYSDEKTMKELRSFLDSLVWMGEEYNFPDKHIWKGLYQTEDSLTLVKYIRSFLELLWT